MAVTVSATESLLSKASGLCCKWKWRSLCRSLFLVKLKAFFRNRNDRFVPDSRTESMFSLKL